MKLRFKLGSCNLGAYKDPSVKRKYTVSAAKLAQTSMKTPGRLRAWKKYAVRPGEQLNPYGCLGNKFGGYWDHLAKRPEAMKRKRLRLKQERERALEAHELQELARQNATLAMRTLIEISGNKRAPEATRIAASSVILDRGYGKASQTSITANVSNGKTSELDADELEKRVKQALERVENLTRRTPKAKPGKTRPADLHKLN